MGKIVLIFKRPMSLYVVRGDEELIDWDKRSRTYMVLKPDGSYFRYLPSVMRYSRTLEYFPGDYRVNETPLQNQYYRINGINGEEICEKYLFRDGNALYNADTEDGRGFPKRQYLTMSRNFLKPLGWETEGNQRYLRFETVTPNSNVSQMTVLSHPWFIHRFDLVGHNSSGTFHTWDTPKGNVYFFLSSAEGYAFIPERYVKEA